MTARCIGGGLARDCERGECNALDACTAMGESTAAAFRRVQQELRRVEAELGSALSALTQAREELAAARRHDDCPWRKLAESAAAERDRARAQLAQGGTP